MRTKNFLIVLCCIITTSMVLIIMGPSSNVPAARESTIRNIFSQTNQQFQHLKDSVVIEPQKQLVVDDKYLSLLGYPSEGRRRSSSSTTGNGPNIVTNKGGEGKDGGFEVPLPASSNTLDSGRSSTEESSSWSSFKHSPMQTEKAEKLSNFSLVSYVVANQLAAAMQLIKNLNAAVPSEQLLLYNLGLSEDDQRTLQKYCYSIMDSAGGHNVPQYQQYSSGRDSSPPDRVVTLLNEAARGAGNEAANTYNTYSVLPNNTISSNSNHQALGSRGSGAYKCWLIKFDAATNGFPSYITDIQMHAFRPLIVRDALRRWARTVLLIDNSVRLRTGAAADLGELRHSVERSSSGIKGWWTEPTLAVSARTHQKMYEYFHTDDDNFKFLKMISPDAMFFVDRPAVNQRILLPWIKCALIPECIDPIGAQSNGCKLNKKPQYRYSGCHDYDASALNIVLGLAFSFDDQTYALDYDREALFYTESLDEATKILEQMRKNISETSEHPFTVD